jgi:hypothetical protein
LVESNTAGSVKEARKVYDRRGMNIVATRELRTEKGRNYEDVDQRRGGLGPGLTICS